MDFLKKYPSLPAFIATLLIFTLAVTFLSEAYGTGAISTSFVKTLGKTLCLALVAISMDLVWGYTGILSLGHFAFFGLGGYMIGMWLMFARTKIIVVESMAAADIPATAMEIKDAVGTQIFGVVGSSDFPLVWMFAHSFWAQIALVVLVPGLLALVFGWLAFRSRVTGVYLSILTQAMTLALSLYPFQSPHGLYHRPRPSVRRSQNDGHPSLLSQRGLQLRDGQPARFVLWSVKQYKVRLP